jgi:hypothetical protein
MGRMSNIPNLLEKDAKLHDRFTFFLRLGQGGFGQVSVFEARVMLVKEILYGLIISIIFRYIAVWTCGESKKQLQSKLNHLSESPKTPILDA